MIGTVLGTSTPGQSGSGNNGNEGALYNVLIKRNEKLSKINKGNTSFENLSHLRLFLGRKRIKIEEDNIRKILS